MTMTRRRFFKSLFGLGASLAVAALPANAKPQSPTIDIPMISGKIDADLSFWDEPGDAPSVYPMTEIRVPDGRLIDLGSGVVQLHGDCFVPDHLAARIYQEIGIRRKFTGGFWQFVHEG